ncbi:hypothetical protein Hanom_Chr03g00236751 [Helianthus anomalus]
MYFGVVDAEDIKIVISPPIVVNQHSRILLDPKVLIRLPYDIAVTLSFNSTTQSETLMLPLHWIICIFCFPIFCSSYLQSR